MLRHKPQLLRLPFYKHCVSIDGLPVGVVVSSEEDSARELDSDSELSDIPNEEAIMDSDSDGAL